MEREIKIAKQNFNQNQINIEREIKIDVKKES